MYGLNDGAACAVNFIQKRFEVYAGPIKRLIIAGEVAENPFGELPGKPTRCAKSIVSAVNNRKLWHMAPPARVAPSYTDARAGNNQGFRKGRKMLPMVSDLYVSIRRNSRPCWGPIWGSPISGIKKC
jgi:hypothetical protein